LKKFIAISVLIFATACHHNFNQREEDSGSKIKSCNGLVSMQYPYYPAKAQALRVEGVVTVSYTVGFDGHPRNVRIISAVPNGFFEGETLRSVERWCLPPNLETQKKVITFRLNGGSFVDESQRSAL